MAWEVWLTFFGAAIAIAVSPGAGAIQSMATGLDPRCATRILEHPRA
jgi:threonine/homoserine/homoserine lactone efflux protein